MRRSPERQRPQPLDVSCWSQIAERDQGKAPFVVRQRQAEALVGGELHLHGLLRGQRPRGGDRKSVV